MEEAVQGSVSVWKRQAVVGLTIVKIVTWVQSQFRCYLTHVQRITHLDSEPLVQCRLRNGRCGAGSGAVCTEQGLLS